MSDQTIKELDRLIERQVRDLLRAAAALRRASREVSRATRGTPQHAEVERLAFAADRLLLTPASRALLAARTSVERAKDEALGRSTTQGLEKEHACGRLDTRHD